MTTVEKLFVQIFERKNRIIRQVKQQTDLYHQNLASKLLIDGVDPPPWLWNPNQSSSDDRKVLNKEELISELFLPHAKPPVGLSGSHYYPYNQSVAQEAGEILGGSLKATYACNNGGTGFKHSHATGFEQNNAGCGIKAVPEVELSVTSPVDETELRISNIYAAQEHSLVRIQRSKSRQKALELRTNEKAKGLRQESALAGSSVEDKLCCFGNKVVNQANGMEDMGEPFVISLESCEVEELNEVDSWKKEKEIVLLSAKFRRSRTSVAEATCVMEGKKADCSDYIQDKSCTQEQHNKEISSFQGSDNEPMEDFSTFNVATDSCAVCEERNGEWMVDGGNGNNASCGRMLSSSSSQQPSCLNGFPTINKLNHSAESKEDLLPKSVGCLVQLYTDAAESCTLAEPSNGLALERTGLKTISCNDVLPTLSHNSSLGHRNRGSESGESFAKMNEYHSTLVDEAATPCAGSGMVNCAKGTSVAVNPDEHKPNNLFKDLTLNSNLILESTRLECLAKTSSDCLKSVDPKQPNFDDTEGCNFNETFCVTLQNRRQEMSAKEVFGNSSDPQVSCCNHFWTTQENLPLEERQKSFRKSESYIGSFESALEEHVQDHMKECRVSASHYSTFRTGQDKSEVLHVQSSTPMHQAINNSYAFQTSDTKNHMDVFSKEGCKFIPDLQIDQRTVERKEKSTSVPHAFEREHLERDYCGGKDELSIPGAVGSANGDDDDLDPLRPREIQFPEKLQSVKGYSGRQKKRRKIEDEETCSFSASASFRIRMEQMKAVNLTMNLEGERETGLEQSNLVKNGTYEQIYPKMSCQLAKTMESSAECIKNEGRLYSEVLTERDNISSSPNLNQGEESIFLTSIKEIGGVSQGCSLNELQWPHGSFNVRQDQKNDLQDEALVNTKGLIDAERTILNGSDLDVASQLSGNLPQSPAEIDLEMIGADQTMPVLEGFIMDSETLNEKVDIPGSEIIFDELGLPRTSLERASILEQICKSASMQTPFTQLSSAFKLQGIHTFHLSVPNGLLECADRKTFPALTGNVHNHIRSKCADETKESFHVMSYSDCLPHSKSRYPWDSRNPFTSPVGKLWEKITSHSDSSGKRLNSNPELTCFPIKEDPVSSEENEDISLPDRVNENVDTVVYTCTKREPLADVSAAYSNGNSSVPVSEKCASKSSLNPVAAEVSFERFHNKIKGKSGELGKSRSEEEENDILLTGATGITKSNDSLNNRYSKISSSYATSSRKEQLKTRHNNIVSNVTSFIPLVQQKQAAASCKGVGKRDIKVKALEAAEAAKRRQEKRDQERKLRKDAVKLERARVERENLRLTELNKKKKEEQKKKKDAEIVAKKRAREEEERKEKERKRKRMEEARLQRLEGGKFVRDKVDKVKQHSIMDGDNKNKDANNKLQKCKDFSMGSRDHVSFENHDVKLTINGSTSEVQHARLSLDVSGTSSDSVDYMKVTPTMAKSAGIDSLIQKIQEKSYEISPYQCSDEEEEEDDDDVPKKKFIPSWASKSCVALVLPLQQDIEPDVIFPADSFCSTSEVVFTRK